MTTGNTERTPTAASVHSGSESRGPLSVVRLRHWERWVAALFVMIGVALLIHTLVTNPHFQFVVVGQYLFSAPIISGVLLTLELTLIAMSIGVVLGTFLAIGRMSSNSIVVGASGAYVWFFRGTPLLVQLIFWYNLSTIFPSIGLGVPFGPQFFHLAANSLITPLGAALMGLGLNEGAYMAEIVRAGVLSVDTGQSEAAYSVGMTRSQALRKIVLPQAMRVIVPPTGNEMISMLKNTSLVSVLAIAELLYSAQIIYARTYQTIPLLIVASLWYLALTTVMSIGQHFIERRFGRGYKSGSSRRRSSSSPLARVARELVGLKQAGEVR